MFRNVSLDLNNVKWKMNQARKKTVHASQNGVRIFKSNLIRTDFVIEIPVFGFWNQEKKNENDITKTTACNVNSDDQYTMMKEEKAS